MEPVRTDIDPTRHDEKENPYRIDDTGDDLREEGQTIPTEPMPSTSTPYNPERKKAETSYIV